MYWFYDSTYILVILAAVISLLASAKVKSTYAKYSNVLSARGLTADQVAQQILNGAGLPQIGVMQVAGDLTDHYNPNLQVVGLSQTVYGARSVAAIGVAAHECGHAIQDAENYAPIRIRNSIVPVVNFGSKLSWPLLLLGLLMSFDPLVLAGIWMFSLVVIFQLVTLPVEFNASRRAMRILEERGILGSEELKGARKVLSAAAMTYVAAAVGSLLQLARLLMIRNARRR